MNKRGFTIIELLVTITVIGILLGIASMSYSNAQRNGRDTTRLSDVSLIGQAIDESTLVLGGLLPGFTSPGPVGTTPSTQTASTQTAGCANLLAGLSENNINIHLFPNRNGYQIMPLDPKPSVVGGYCTSAAHGYYYEIYNTQGTDNDANSLGRRYVIEVGLENSSNLSQSQFQISPTQLTFDRTYYVLPGPVK